MAAEVAAGFDAFRGEGERGGLASATLWVVQ